MKSVTLEQWTAALRSGKYEQGSGYLQSDNRFCCLGVLCDMIGLERVERGEGIVDYDFTPFMSDGSSRLRLDDCVIPMNAQGNIMQGGILAKMMPKDAELVGEPAEGQSLHNRLMIMNDDGYTFAQIADYIDSLPKENTDA